ncbi:hypothetical protein PABG_11485 [Paracoccidioides brasiliensis Pb03]|nr:hypothetical protein PABG_11485 [Paracoccidioides brasiliensis Pb03]
MNEMIVHRVLIKGYNCPVQYLGFGKAVVAVIDARDETPCDQPDNADIVPFPSLPAVALVTSQWLIVNPAVANHGMVLEMLRLGKRWVAAG